jgi:hypothetical protein
VTYRRTIAVAIACSALAACADIAGPPNGGATDNAALFDQTWRDVDLHYSYFDYKGIDWDSLGAVYRPRAVAAASGLELARVLGRMLAELRDVHVSLTPVGVGGPIRYVSRYDTADVHFDEWATLSRYVSGVRRTSGGHVIFGMADSVTGYVRIPTFEGRDWASELDEALNALSTARNLIVDVRNNPGGRRALAFELAGRFADRERTFAYLRQRNGPSHHDFTDYTPVKVNPAGAAFRGDVYLLTNRKSCSSAEEFALALRVQPRVTVLGDTTAGASGGPVPRELPNGWIYQISEWIEYTLTGAIVQDVGVAPDVVVIAHPYSMTLGRDAMLERALLMARSR